MYKMKSVLLLTSILLFSSFANAEGSHAELEIKQRDSVIQEMAELIFFSFKGKSQNELISFLNSHPKVKQTPNYVSAEPNYVFWDIFRVAKYQGRAVTTGLFSTWTDNRTILMGDGLEAAGGYKFDFVADGFEKDPAFEPALGDVERIQAVDLEVTTLAAKTLLESAPDLSWVYLQHTDDIGHRDGDGPSMDLAVRWVDARVSELWTAVQERGQQFANEDWLVIVTTDHGRTSSNGKGHGGQSDRERTIWIASNSPRMVSPAERSAAIVDIYPTIAEHMRFDMPEEVAAQLEGQSLLSK